MSVVGSRLAASRLGLRGGQVAGFATAPPPVTEPPANTVAPQITYATPLIPGVVITCDPGSWTNLPTSFSYDFRADGVTVQNGPSNTYTVRTADIGKVIVCVVSATNDAGMGSHNSNISVTVIAPPPVNSALPVITYSSPINWGQTLTCSTGTWSNSPTAFNYKWTRVGGESGVIVKEGASNFYVVQPGDVASAITCEVTASNPAGAGTPATSVATPQVMNFQPGDLSGLVAFFQPYNPGSVVLVSGKVSQLTNMAPGNTNHLGQTVAASQPTIATADINGKDVLQAATNGPWLENLAVTGLTGSAYSSFVIANMSSGGSTSGRAFTLCPASVADGSNTSFIPFVKAATNDSYNTQAGTSNLHPATLSSWHGLFATRDNAALNSWLDGGDARTVVPGGSIAAIVRMAMFANFAAGAIGSTRATAKVLTALLYNRVLSTTERQKVEGWGMWLAGLQSLLPTDHPYKSAAP